MAPLRQTRTCLVVVNIEAVGPAGDRQKRRPHGQAWSRLPTSPDFPSRDTNCRCPIPRNVEATGDKKVQLLRPWSGADIGSGLSIGLYSACRVRAAQTLSREGAPDLEKRGSGDDGRVMMGSHP